jgi:hypothetical protein
VGWPLEFAQFATLNFQASHRQAFDGFRICRLNPRQIFSDFADCARHPGRDQIVCTGIKVRFREIKRA